MAAPSMSTHASAEKLLPQNVEAEAGTLGSILIDPESISQVSDFLRATMFYREANREVYAALADMDEAGIPIDLITLTDELERRGTLDKIGGVSYVSSLANQVPTSANIEHYARIVERTSVLRQLIHAAGTIAALGYNEPDADVALERAEALLRDIARGSVRVDSLDLADVLDDFLEEIHSGMEAGGFVGVQTGFVELDRAIMGIAPTEVAYLCGRPGSGKSTVAAAIALANARRCASEGRGSVEWITLEMRAVQQAKRLISALAEVDGRIIRAHFRRPDGSIDMENYHRVRAQVEQTRTELRGRLHVLDRPASLSTLRKHIARAVYERGCTFVVLDYIGLIAPEERGSRSNEYQRIMDLSREIKGMALEFTIPILCLVQMSRAAEMRRNKRPVLTDLRDAGGLEQDADFVLGVYRPAYYDKQKARDDYWYGRLMEVSVLKARDSQSDLWVPLEFTGEYTRVRDWASNIPVPEDETRDVPADSEGGKTRWQ